MASYTYVDLNRIDLENNLTKDNSIRASISNIILTLRGTLPGAPEFGSDVYRYLFEPLTVFTKISLEDNIKSSLYRNDDRLQDLKVTLVEDNANYAMNAVVEFTTKDDLEPHIVTINLKG